MQPRDVLSKAIHLIPDAAKNLWEGFPEDTSQHSLLLSIINAYGIMTLTSTSPFVAVCIAAIGLKRMCHGTYQLGSSLYTTFSKNRKFLR